VVDLEVLPWPWPDNSFDEIFAKDILEHIGANPKEFIKIIGEMYRVSKPGAIWKVIVPHWRCDLAFDDPTHVRVITASTFKLFDQAKNVEAWKNKRADSLLGIINEIDVEITDNKFNIIEYWKNEVENQNLTNRQLDLKLNTLNNVAESTEITLLVHKPCRYNSWAEKFIGEK
jgi:ubiquinone/menaquinone biosynthesis C-methylase UbiE